MKTLKCIISGVVAATFLFGVVGSSMAESIGYIDVTKVFKEYKETEKAEEELKKKKEDYEKEFKDAQEKLESAEKDKKSFEEIEKLRGELEEKLEPKRKELFRLNEELTNKLQGSIVTAVESVAKKIGIDVVVDKQVMITGGVDLTEMVIKELNK